MKTFKMVVPYPHPHGYYWHEAPKWCALCEEYGGHWKFSEIGTVEFSVDAETQEQAMKKAGELGEQHVAQHEEQIVADMQKWFKFHNSRDWPRDRRGRPLFLDKEFNPNVEVEKCCEK